MQQEKHETGTWSECSGAAVRRASRQLGQLYDDVLAPSGLRTTQFSLLTQILVGETPTLKSLAEAMVMDLSALGHTLKPLIRDGLVELVPDAKDRRVKRVRLTGQGQRKRDEAHSLWEQAQARFDAAFGAEQSAALRRAMAVIATPEFAQAFRK
ncbi:MarR family winged helix-turn-helix transcriptional regulator [Rhizobium sp. RAF56]|jgi:DNA-binding MarR family transcriptional regulator|uniref:MarR family winged helix-turn-helix transcriptional regulator n=1 Tax=Rhizobium sp. RAF56 TaxID=3233062 RepID=UPI003F99614A